MMNRTLALILIFVSDLRNGDFVTFEHDQLGITFPFWIISRQLEALGVQRPHIIRIRQAEILIETMMQGEELRRIAQVPFAEYCRGVAALFN